MPEYKAWLCSMSVDESAIQKGKAAIYLHFKRNQTYFRYAKFGPTPQIRELHSQLEFDKLYSIYTTDNIHVISIKEVESENEIQAKGLRGMRKEVFSARS